MAQAVRSFIGVDLGERDLAVVFMTGLGGMPALTKRYPATPESWRLVDYLDGKVQVSFREVPELKRRLFGAYREIARDLAGWAASYHALVIVDWSPDWEPSWFTLGDAIEYAFEKQADPGVPRRLAETLSPGEKMRREAFRHFPTEAFINDLRYQCRRAGAAAPRTARSGGRGTSAVRPPPGGRGSVPRGIACTCPGNLAHRAVATCSTRHQVWASGGP